MSKKNPDKVVRFNAAERLGHWCHAVCFVLLLLTGSAFAFTSLNHALGAGSLAACNAIHRFIAYPFTVLSLVVLLLGTPRSFFQWLKDCFSWSREDWQFIKDFPREFFVLPVKLPEQGRFNAGEKVNSLLTILGSLVIIITGWTMARPEAFSPAWVAWAHPLHSFTALLLGGVLLGHVYLAILHPRSRESIWGMLRGTVSTHFAASHHGKWYKQISG